MDQLKTSLERALLARTLPFYTLAGVNPDGLVQRVSDFFCEASSSTLTSIALSSRGLLRPGLQLVVAVGLHFQGTRTRLVGSWEDQARYAPGLDVCCRRCVGS